MKLVSRKRGIFAAFIDLRKASDSVDRNTLWTCFEDLGLQRRLVEFLRVTHADLSYEMKVGEFLNEGQGCILSPLLFSLYISLPVVEMKRAGVGVDCRGQRNPALPYADDIVLLAEEDMLKEELKMLGVWCRKWAIKVNVEIYSIVHVRKRG